jgi:hypothetical protein
VIVGRSWRHAAPGRRTAASGRDWAALVLAAAADRRGGGFIVQRAIASPSVAQILCTPDQLSETRVTCDYAAFASVGAVAPWGGTVRACASDVVNIAGGGAVAPVLRRSVAEHVLRRIEAVHAGEPAPQSHREPADRRDRVGNGTGGERVPPATGRA